MQKQLTNLYPSRAFAIRSSFIFGLKLCALARTENKVGSVRRAEQLLAKAKHIIENTLRDLEAQTQISVSEMRRLGKLAEHLKASIWNIDPLWIPNAQDLPSKRDSFKYHISVAS